MNKQELAAAIEAARKNLELAQQELARLEAIKPDCMPLMVIETTRKYLSRYFFVDENLESATSTENNDQADNTIFKSGNYFHTKEQAAAYARAFRTMLLIRRQPGIVGYGKDETAWNIDITELNIYVRQLQWSSFPSIYMLPCFKTEDAARAAIEAVGADNLIFTARFLAGAE